MSKNLVAYFSTRGITKRLANKVAEALGADIFEIEPAVPYTYEDLIWTDEESRSSKEMKDRSYRPAVKSFPENIEEYDTIYVGFPIWWYTAPTIINTFLEGLDLKGKTVVPFATAGRSGMGDSAKDLAVSCKGAEVKEGKVFNSGTTKEQIIEWADSLK